MDLFPDFKDLLAAFAASGVRYLLIGGYAVIFHGRPRATKDMDLLVSLDDANRERLVDALSAFGASPTVIGAARSMTVDDIVYFGVSPLRVTFESSSARPRCVVPERDAVRPRDVAGENAPPSRRVADSDSTGTYAAFEETRVERERVAGRSSEFFHSRH